MPAKGAPQEFVEVFCTIKVLVDPSKPQDNATVVNVYAPFAGSTDTLLSLLTQAAKLVAIKGELAAQAAKKPNRASRRAAAREATKGGVK